MILVLSTFNGIDLLVKDLYSAMDAPLTISPKQGKYLNNPDDIGSYFAANHPELSSSPVLQGQVVLQSGKQQLVATLLGIDSSFYSITRLDTLLNRGSAELLFNPGTKAIVLGAGLHYHLKRGFEFPSFDPLVVLNIPSGTRLKGAGFSAFNKTALTEIGTFSVTAEFDLNYAYVSREVFLEIFNLPQDAVSYLAVSGPDIKSIQAEMKEKYSGDYRLESQEEKNAILYQTSQSEKWISFSILFFIVLVAAFNIVASLCILVMEKRSDLFILKVLGLSELQISKVFFLQSIMINSLGMALGFLLGIGLVFLQQEVGLLRLQGSVVEFYPVALNPMDLLIVLTTILGIAVITFWPVNKLVRRLV